MTAAPKSTKILVVLKKATIKIRLPLPAHSCLDDDLGSWESRYNFLKNTIIYVKEQSQMLTKCYLLVVLKTLH